MSPSRPAPVRKVGPMRVVIVTYPSREAALAAVDSALGRHLAACGNVMAADSHYWWKGRIESAAEAVVWFKTVPARVGRLFRYLKESHPYEVPEIAEIDVSRVDPRYLEYLARTLEPASPPPPRGGGLRHRGGRRAPGARAPGRTRARPRPRSR